MGVTLCEVLGRDTHMDHISDVPAKNLVIGNAPLFTESHDAVQYQGADIAAVDPNVTFMVCVFVEHISE
nr:hypothetical protein [Nocardia fusca]